MDPDQFKTYRAEKVRNLVKTGDVPCGVPGFMPWAVMQGIVTEGECDGPFLWVCARSKKVHVGRRAYYTEDLGDGRVRVGEGILRYNVEAGSGVVSLMLLTQSVPRIIDDWERWARACDVVVGVYMGDATPSALELLASVGAVYGQAPDIVDDHEIVELRRCLRMAQSRMYVDTLWWIDAAAQTLVAYGRDGFRVKRLLMRNRGTQLYMWPRLTLDRSALVDANRHVGKMLGTTCLPYIPYDRLITFLVHVPDRYLPTNLHEVCRLGSWRGFKINSVDYDVLPAMLSFRGDLTIPARVGVDESTYYFHALVTLPSSSDGQIVFGVGDGESIDCNCVLSRMPGQWSEYEGAGWAVRSVSRRVRGSGYVFMEIGILVFEARTFAVCANNHYGDARIRITWGVVGVHPETHDLVAVNEKFLFGAHTRDDGRYVVFLNGGDSA